MCIGIGGYFHKMKIEGMINRALQFCVEKSSTKDTASVERLIQENDRWANSTFRYALGKEICKFLSQSYEEIESCYIFGSSLSDTAHIASDIDLVIEVKSNSKELREEVSKLDSQVLNYFKSRLNGKAKGLNNFLDVYFVDDTDIKKRRGFGTVVSSLHTPPIKILGRNGKSS